MIQQGVMELPRINKYAQLKNLNFNSLAILQNYAKDGQDGKDMKGAFNKALKDFGITTDQLNEMQEAFRTYTVHHHLMDKEEKEVAKATLSSLMEPIVGAISEKMQSATTAYKPFENVIVDMLMSENVMPVHQEGFFSALDHNRLFNPQILGIDLTQAMPAFDEGHGEKGVANVIYRLSQLAKSAMKSRSAWRSSTRSSNAVGLVRAGAKRFLLSSLSNACRSRVVQARISFFAVSMKAAGQRGSAGSGHKDAQMTARHAANGRRAHQMCSVEMCPCRMDFSRRA
jgi:hypothetical protein